MVHSHRFHWQRDVQNLETKLLGQLCGRRVHSPSGCTGRMICYVFQFLEGNNLAKIRWFQHLWKCSHKCGCGTWGGDLMMNLVLGWWLRILKVFNNSMIWRHPGVQILLPEFQDSLLCERSSSRHKAVSLLGRNTLVRGMAVFTLCPSFLFMNIREFRCSCSFAYSLK